MKLSPSLRASVLALLALAAPSFSASYMAEGVIYGNETGSSRFFDAGKGSYWAQYVSYQDVLYQPMPGVIKLANEEKSYDFLGERLNQYISTPYAEGSLPGYSTEHTLNGNSVTVTHETSQSWSTLSTVFANLGDDGDMCWAYSASNALQYWSSYYGVFSDKAAEMPYGYTYRDGKDDAQALGGTQSLNISMEMYEHFKNTTGGAYTAVSWWLSGTKTMPYGEGDEEFWYGGDLTPSLEDPNENSDGYFSTYYPAGGDGNTRADEPTSMLAEVTTLKQIDSTSYQISCKVDSNSEMADKIARSLGYEKQADGTYKLAEKGLLATVDLRSGDHGSGHAITAHGFEVDENGNVALIVSNPDDAQYSLFKLYLKQEGNCWFTYTDAGCTEKWEYSRDNWYILDFEYINTTDELKAMRALYDSNTLVWKGSNGNDTWENNAESAIAEALPTGISNWKVEVSDGAATTISEKHEGFYDSYYGNGRDVLFDDSAQDTSVVLTEGLEAGHVSISNSTKAYEFSGNHSLSADNITKTGAESAVFSGVQLAVADEAGISGAGLLKLRSGAKLTMGQSFSLQQKLLTTDASLANATLRVTAAGGSLHGVSSSDVAVISNTAVQVMSDNALDLKNARLMADSMISGDSSQLTVTNVSLELGNLNTITSNLVYGSTLQLLGGSETLMYEDGDMILALSGNTLQGLKVSGHSLSLDFSVLADSGTLFDGYDFVSLSFTDTIFEGLDTLTVTGIFGTEEFKSYYSLQEYTGAGQVATLYFAMTSASTDVIPEPTTVSLSLLALVGLAARRRRR